MRLLGIETSCDETSASVVEDGRTILSNVVSSQIPTHRRFGGVVPEVASREHVRLIIPVIDAALEEASTSLERIGAIAVAYGPGLVGSLLVGVSAAKALSVSRGIPLVAVNHVIGHLYANFLAHRDLSLPAICLTVSGGHTEILYLGEDHEYRVLGSTRDDAAGEAFDKVARVLGLEYPGGPAIDRIAREGDPEAIDFPRPMVDEDNLDFSFSGIKTAVINYIHHCRQRGESFGVPDVAASFEKAVVDVLVAKTIRAAIEHQVHTLLLSGGVAANTRLRSDLSRAADGIGCRLLYPPASLCTDNAAMIACAGYYAFLRGDRAGTDLNAVPGLTL